MKSLKKINNVYKSPEVQEAPDKEKVALKKANEKLSDKELSTLMDLVVTKTQAEMSDAFDFFLKQWKKGSIITAEGRVDISTKAKKTAFIKDQYEKAQAKVVNRDAEFSKEYGKIESTSEDVMRQLLSDIDFLHSEEIKDKKTYAAEYKLLKGREKITKSSKIAMEKLGVQTAEHIVFDKDGKSVKRIETPPTQFKHFKEYVTEAIGRPPSKEDLKVAEEIKNQYAVSMFVDIKGNLKENAKPKTQEELKAKRKFAYTKEGRLTKLPGKDESRISFLVDSPEHPVFAEIKEQLNAEVTDNLDDFETALDSRKAIKLVYNREELPIILKKKRGESENIMVSMGVGEYKQEFEADKYSAGILFEKNQTDPEDMPLLFALGMDYGELTEDSGASIYFANKILLKDTYGKMANEMFA